jgi:osmotically-inducible protein OsmY
LIKIVFGTDPTDVLLYDLLVNTDHYTAENAADLVAHAIEKVQKIPDADAMAEKLKHMALAKRVEALVRKKLSSAVAQHIDMSAEEGGRITISGHVRERSQKEKIAHLAASFPGVTQVDNQLKVTDLTFGV